MERTTIYWILFFGLLESISWLRITQNDYNQPFLHQPRSNQYEAAQVGDLYIIKDSIGTIQNFFKIIETTQFGRAVPDCGRKRQRLQQAKLIREKLGNYSGFEVTRRYRSCLKMFCFKSNVV